MRFLLLNGHGIRFKVEKARIIIVDGRYSVDEEPKEYSFRPKRLPYDHIVIYGRSGEISIEAIRWLIKHNVAITLLNWNGELLTNMLPPESVQVKTKFSQYSSYRNSELRLELAKKFIEAKLVRSKILLEWVKSRYPNIKFELFQEKENMQNARDIREVMLAEARAGIIYWKQLAKVFPDKYEFDKRQYSDTPYGASDKINCMLNYGYAILEAECLRAINIAGLDPHVGFLHEIKMGSKSLAYDLQEPFRFLIDLAVISAVEKKKMQDKDFIRTENYNLRLKPTGAKKLIEEITLWFNRKVKYQNKMYKWGNLLVEQTRQLAHYIVGKKGMLDFSEPYFEIKRDDTDEIREIISNMPYKKWEDLGFSKGTLHPLKQKVKEGKHFTLNKHVKERLLTIQN